MRLDGLQNTLSSYQSFLFFKCFKQVRTVSIENNNTTLNNHVSRRMYNLTVWVYSHPSSLPSLELKAISSTTCLVVLQLDRAAAGGGRDVDLQL